MCNAGQGWKNTPPPYLLHQSKPPIHIQWWIKAVIAKINISGRATPFLWPATVDHQTYEIAVTMAGGWMSQWSYFHRWPTLSVSPSGSEHCYYPDQRLAPEM